LIGSTSDRQRATLSNTGTTCFQFSSIGITGDFAQSNNCSGGVRGGSSCVFNITFTPSAIGTRSGMLAVTGFDGVTTTTASVSLSPSSVIPGSNGANSAPTLSTSGNTPRGTFNVQIVGISGVTQHSTTVQLTVN